jgi:hypothetical protein
MVLNAKLDLLDLWFGVCGLGFGVRGLFQYGTVQRLRRVRLVSGPAALNWNGAAAARVLRDPVTCTPASHVT